MSMLQFCISFLSMMIFDFECFSFFFCRSEQNLEAAKKLKLNTDKNPVMLLNELKPGLKYEIGECGGDSPATKRFVISVVIDGQTFEGSGEFVKIMPIFWKISSK